MKCPNSAFNGQRYRCGIYTALFKTTSSSCTFVVKQKLKTHRSSIFIFSDSLPTLKSNTIFSKITLMALEKFLLKLRKIWFTSFWSGLMSNSNNTPSLKQKISKALIINIIKKSDDKISHMISEMKKITLQIRLFMILMFHLMLWKTLHMILTS